MPDPGQGQRDPLRGLAEMGDRIFIGVRGPALRGLAVIVELKADDGPDIEPQPIGPGNRRYRKYQAASSTSA